MDLYTVTLMLLISSYTPPLFFIHADESTDGVLRFDESVVAFQNDIRNLCSYVEKTPLVAANTFKTLMKDTYIDSPNDNRIKIRLANMKQNAKKYHALVMKQSSA
jgi:hypothetical protein